MQGLTVEIATPPTSKEGNGRFLWQTGNPKGART
jgi:hypothetical protein